MVKETGLTTKILKALRSRGAKVEKIRGSAFLTKGTPDILGCYLGQALAIEVKRPGKEETLKQHLELMAWKKAGAIVGVVRSVEEALRLVCE